MTDIRNINPVSSPSTSNNDLGGSTDSSSGVDNKSISNELSSLTQTRDSMRAGKDESEAGAANQGNIKDTAIKGVNDSKNKQNNYDNQISTASNTYDEAVSNAGKLRGEANELRALAKKNPKLKQVFLEQAAQREAQAIAEDQKAQQALNDEADVRRKKSSEEVTEEDFKTVRDTSIKAQNQLNDSSKGLKTKFDEANTNLKTTTANSGQKTSNDSGAKNSSVQNQNSQVNTNATSTTQNTNTSAVSATANTKSNSTLSGAQPKTSSTSSNRSSSSSVLRGASTSSSSTGNSGLTLGTATAVNSVLGGASGTSSSGASSTLGAANAAGGGGTLGAAGGDGGVFSGVMSILQQIATLNRQPLSPHPTAQKSKWNSIQSLAERGMAEVEAITLDQTITGTPLHQFAVLIKTIMAAVLGEARGNSEFHGKEIEEYKKAEKDTHQHAQRA